MDSMEQLQSLLHLCTVRLADLRNPDERGTGFFVAPGLILACAHVVENAQRSKTSVSVRWADQSYTAKIERFLDKPYPDLALLKVDNLVNHPCVYLHEKVQAGDNLYSYGYTDKYPNGDPATFVCEGLSNEPQQLIKFKFGEVRSGLSGGPLLNQLTGGICGIVKLTRGTDAVMGGRAIPASIVFREFPELITKQQEFHQQDKRWHDCLTPPQRQILGLVDIQEAFEVFFSYARKDEKLKDELEKHLTLMQREGLITTWNTHKIEPGIDQASSMSEHLEKARIILLLISADFMASNYRDGIEIERAMKKHRAGTARVIPVILRSADWKSAPFGRLVPLPTDGKPITKWQDRDEAFLDVTQGIRGVVKSLKQANPQSAH